MRSSALLPALCALCALAGQLQAFEVSIEPAVLLVEHGSSIRLKCKTTCPDPAAKGNLETSIRKHDFQSGPGEMSVELINITEWRSSVLCSYTCSGIRKTESAELVTYRALEQPVLELVPWMEEGESRNLTCWVPEVAPVRNLTVTLRRGAEILHTHTFQNDTHVSPVHVPLTWEVTARRQHHGLNVTCQAVLSLEPHGPRFSRTAAPVTLAVYDFPADPELGPEMHLEVNETANATCTIHTLFPAARFALSLDGRPLPVSVSEDGRRAVAELSLPQPGAFGLVCAGQVGPRERRAQTTVHVYSFPAPQLHVSTAGPAAGETVAVQCTLPAGHSPQIQLRLRSEARLLTSWSTSPLHWALAAHEEDNGIEIVCEAKLPAGGKVPKTSAPVRLSITYKPRLDEAGCPQQQRWTEGQEAALRCSARGNPPPSVACARDGQPFPVAVLQPATRAHAGSYRCWATNRLGTAERTVTVLVEHHDPPVLLAVLLAAAVLAVLALTGAAYGIYYRKKKIRQYKLQEKQRQLELQALAGSSAKAAPNGSAPAAEPLNSPPPLRQPECLSRRGRVLLQPGCWPGSCSEPAARSFGASRKGWGIPTAAARTPSMRTGPLLHPFPSWHHSPTVGTRPGRSPWPRPRCRPPAAMPRHGRPALALALAVALLALRGRVAPEPTSSPFAVAVAGPTAVPYGSTVLVNCSTTCPEAAARGLETSLAKRETRRGPGWLVVQLLNVTEPSTHLVCYFTCFGQRKVAPLTVVAYRFPDPRLALSSPNASLRQPVAAECSSAPSQPPGLLLHLRSSRGAQESGKEGRVRLELMAGEEDDGLEFVCEAELPVGNRTLRKSSAPATLSVTYEPRLDEAGCPQQQRWTEGQEAALRCSARGNPPPSVACARDGQPFPVAVLQPATRAHAGSYRCWATNRLGTAERTVAVLVEHHDRPVLLAVLLAAAVLAVLALTGAAYGIYYRKKKIGQYKLQEKQRPLELQALAGSSAKAAPNGSAPAAEP
ncbi:intercellular adhesion molecule 1-like [Struthio camelus]|uniref:intercellular adhesion molecule 1-like n=1 Tax=Struthio camelus TaxID=8801 RepID=UPI003603CD82